MIHKLLGNAAAKSPFGTAERLLLILWRIAAPGTIWRVRLATAELLPPAPDGARPDVHRARDGLHVSAGDSAAESRNGFPEFLLIEV